MPAKERNRFLTFLAELDLLSVLEQFPFSGTPEAVEPYNPVATPKVYNWAALLPTPRLPFLIDEL